VNERRSRLNLFAAHFKFHRLGGHFSLRFVFIFISTCFDVLCNFVSVIVNFPNSVFGIIYTRRIPLLFLMPLTQLLTICALFFLLTSSIMG
jgi:hypothetical protein